MGQKVGFQLHFDNLNPGQNDVSLIFPIIERPAAGFASYDMAGMGAGLFVIGFHP